MQSLAFHARSGPAPAHLWHRASCASVQRGWYRWVRERARRPYGPGLQTELERNSSLLATEPEDFPDFVGWAVFELQVFEDLTRTAQLASVVKCSRRELVRMRNAMTGKHCIPKCLSRRALFERLLCGSYFCAMAGNQSRYCNNAILYARTLRGNPLRLKIQKKSPGLRHPAMGAVASR